MSELPNEWMVKRNYTARKEPLSLEFATDNDGLPIGFVEGIKLSIDKDKTVRPEVDGVLMQRRWLFLTDARGGGYVPYNSDDPEHDRSVALQYASGRFIDPGFTLYPEEIDLRVFLEFAVLKSIRFNTNAAYIVALAYVESGGKWLASKVLSPSKEADELGTGTFGFRPLAWGALVEARGEDERIKPEYINLPQPQLTFASIQAGDSAKSLEEKLGRKPRYVELYMAHLFTIDGTVKLLEAEKSDAAQSITPVVEEIFAQPNNSDKDAVLKDLQKRKKFLFDATGKGKPVGDAIKALVIDINRGFNEVRNIAATIYPNLNINGEKTVAPGVGSSELGILSEEFESRGNPAAIGWDSTGGHSYGKYQIASKIKTFSNFMKYLQTNHNNIFLALENAGGAQAARAGTKQFKQAWRDLVSVANFVEAQHGFIKLTHYDVMVKKMNSLIETNNRSIAFQNVIWSTAVQHGPFSSVVSRAIKNQVKLNNDPELINLIYDERSKVNKYFGSSTASVRASVKNRFKKERLMALEMLARETV